jgi:restriction endonuclease S subunit
MSVSTGTLPNGWTTKRLGELAHVKTGSRNNQDKDARGRYPFFVRSSQVERIDSFSYSDEAILIPGEGGIGSIFHYVNGPHEVHQRVYRISDFADDLDPRYLYCYIARFFGAHAMQNTVKATVDSLRLPTFLEFVVALPPIDEQRAITAALSDASAWVESLDALIAKKRDVRNALLQQCFRGPSDLTPSGSHWSRVALRDVVTLEKGELITEATSGNGNIPVIAGGLKPSYYTDRFNRTGRLISVSASGANAGYVALRQGPLWASDCTTISESTNYDLIFLLAQLQLLQDQIYRAQTGGAQPHIHAVDLAPIVIHWCDLSSQIALGRVLMDIDAEIEALVSQRDKAELIRQGMAEDLLSGKVRLA